MPHAATSRRRCHLALVLTALLIFAGLMSVSSPAIAAPFPQKLAVPAYFYPSFIDPFVPHPTAPYNVPGHPEYDYWWRMCTGLTNAGGGTVIVNPQGADRTSSANFDYQTNIMFCHKDHTGAPKPNRIIGYVTTDYGNRALVDVLADIDNLYAFYHSYTVSAVPEVGINGIFLDEMYNKVTNALDPTAVTAYYAAIYTHVKSKDATAVVVGNPGIPDATDWQLTTPAADELVAFEGTPAAHAAWSAPSWVTAQDPADIWNLVHSASSSQLPTVKSNMFRGNAGHYFVTDADGLWTTFPDEDYWLSEYNGTNLSVVVDPSFSFSVGNLASTCNDEPSFDAIGGGPTSVALGRMAPTSTKSAGQHLTVTSNASAGFRVYIRGVHAGGSLRNPQHQFADVDGTHASPLAIGVGERFGYTYRDDTVASSVTDPPSATFAALTNANANAVMGSDTSANGDGCVSFAVQTTNLTPAGSYNASVTYTAVPQY